MATVQTPHTWTAGDDATSTNLQTMTNSILQLQGGSPSAGPLDFAYLARTTNLALPAATATDVPLGEFFDAAGGHDNVTNTHRYTGKTPGWYELHYSARFEGNASGSRILIPYANGTLLAGDPRAAAKASDSGPTGLCGSAWVYLNGLTDYVSLVVQSSVALNLEQATLLVRWIRS